MPNKKLFEMMDKMHREMQEMKSEMQGEFVKARDEMQEGLRDVRNEMQEGLRDVRDEMQEGFMDVRNEMQEGFKNVNSKIEVMQTDIDEIKYSLKGVTEQTGDLTEFRAETNTKLNKISDDIEFLKHQDYETKQDLFNIKRNIKSVK